MAQNLVKDKGLSIRFACQVFGISETCYRHKATLSGENLALADWLLRLSQAKKRWGFWPMFSVLKRRQRLRLEPQSRVPYLP